MIGGPGTSLYGAEEKKELMDVIEGGHLFRFGIEGSDGFQHKVENFERELSEKMGLKHVVATNSGASSLTCCLAALGIGAGDEVIVPGFTFIASISSIVLGNAIPVLAEVDDSLTIDPSKIEALITSRTRAIMPVHLLGNTCDMDAVMLVAKKHDLYVIEDCCQAVGASFKGKRVGNYGDIAAFSFNAFKMISSGDGGAVGTNDSILYERAYGFHDQGHKPLRKGVELGNRNMLGMNMRMNELTGAVLLAQLRKLDGIIDTLRNKKAKLKGMLQGLPHIRFRKINDEAGECATLLTLLFDTVALAESFCEELGSKPLAYSDWHAYNNMEQLLNRVTVTGARCPYDCPRYEMRREYKKHMLPQTDEILSRAANISVGVVDEGLGAGFGINVNSSDSEIEQVGGRLIEVIEQL